MSCFRFLRRLVILTTVVAWLVTFCSISFVGYNAFNTVIRCSLHTIHRTGIICFYAQILLSVYKFVNRLMKFHDKNMVKSLLFFYGRCVHLVLFLYANGCWIFPMFLLLIFCLILRKEFHRLNKDFERFVQDISNLDSGSVRVTFEQIRLRSWSNLWVSTIISKILNC